MASLKNKPDSTPKKSKIGVIYPSRGLVFSESMEEMLRELKDFDHEIFFAHGLPIPDCFNVPLTRALEDKSFSHILLLEDDMMLPKGILKKMVDLDYPAVALDYPFKNDGEATILHDPDGYAIYSGTGCLLVWRTVFDKMKPPYFRTDLAWDTRIEKGKLIMWPRDVSNIKTYGLHDINFGLMLYTNGIPILPAAPVGQRKLVSLGKTGTNNGAHIIKELTKVGIDNITKTDDEEMKRKWVAALSTVKSVEILDTMPDDVEVVDGQTRLKTRKDIVI